MKLKNALDYIQKRFTYHKTCRDFDERNARAYRNLCNHQASVLATNNAKEHQACMYEITTILAYITDETWQNTYEELDKGEENDNNSI